MNEAWGVWLVAVGFLALFFGYSVGRRSGRREGLLEGLAFAPLEVRRLSWEKGTCLVCGNTAGLQDQGENGEAQQGES